MVENTWLWDKTRKTRPEDVRQVELGHKYTAIKPHSQLEEATQVFGPYGLGWGLKDLQFTSERHLKPTGEEFSLIALQCVFWAKSENGDIEFPVAADMMPDKRGLTDARKKLLTSCQSKALSKLGFNKDVFSGLWEDQEYVRGRELSERSEAEKLSEGTDYILSCTDPVRLMDFLGKVPRITANGNMSPDTADKLLQIGEQRKKALGIPDEEKMPPDVRVRYILKSLKLGNRSPEFVSSLTGGKYGTADKLLADQKAVASALEALDLAYEEAGTWIGVRDLILGDSDAN